MSDKKCEYCGETHPGRTAFGCDYLHPRPATMSERKLSEELRDYAEAVRQGFEDVPADDWADRAAALEAELAAEKAHTARLEKYDVMNTEDRRKLEAEVAKLTSEGIADRRFAWEGASYTAGLERQRDALAAENERLRKLAAELRGRLGGMDLLAGTALNVVRESRDALAAENTALKARNTELEELWDANSARVDLLEARIAETVKVLRDGDGPVEDDFEGAVREALAILEHEGEKP